MKISVFGMLPFSNLIKEGFTKLGHEISDKNPELIYANDPRGYKKAIQINSLAYAKHSTTNEVTGKSIFEPGGFCKCNKFKSKKRLIPILQ